jgi:hypothetical protein
MSNSKQISVAFVALIVSIAFAWIICSYVAIPEPPIDKCWYEIKYLHISGREITKRVFMTCEGFYHWEQSPRNMSMVLPFPDGSKVTIQGATDILSVVKLNHNE